MTKEQLATIEGVTLTIAGGVAIVYPPAAPLMDAIKALVVAAENHGIIPVEVPAEQLAAIAAGMAAARASAVTGFNAHRKDHP